jgi:hypothetical protein
MSNITRNEFFEEQFKTIYGIDAEIHASQARQTSTVLIKVGDKEVKLFEQRHEGLTKEATVTFEGITHKYSTYAEAEQKAVEFLGGKNGNGN